MKDCIGLGGTHRKINKPNERKIYTNTLFHLGFVEIISSPVCHQKGLSIANLLASTDNYIKATNTHQYIAEYNNRQRILTMRQYTMNTHKKILG